MKLSKQAALELTASLWLEIYFGVRLDLDPRTRRLGSSLRSFHIHKEKTSALRELGFGTAPVAPQDLRSNCPCCEFAWNQMVVKDMFPDYGDCFEFCPLLELWPEGCESIRSSPYGELWFDAGDLATEEAAAHCLTIAKKAGELAGTWHESVLEGGGEP